MISKNSEELDLYNFEAIIKPIEDFLKKHWETNTLKPKGYDKCIKDSTYEEGISAEEEQQLKDDFKGMDDATACTPALPIMLSLYFTAYSDVDQGRSPLCTVIEACVRHGMIIQETRIRKQLGEAKKEVEELADLFLKNIKEKRTDTSGLEPLINTIISKMEYATLKRF